jgi:hypothetical protein
MVNQSVSLHLGPMTRYLLLFDSYGLVFVGRPLWREDGSVFCICCWPLPAHSRVPVPWDSRPYFTVSYLRLPFSSPPTTLRVMVEVFNPAFIRAEPKVKVTLRLMVSQSWCRCLTVTVLLLWGTLSDERTGLSFFRVIVCISKSFVIM